MVKMLAPHEGEVQSGGIISRRLFLRGTAALTAGALASISGCSIRNESTETTQDIGIRASSGATPTLKQGLPATDTVEAPYTFLPPAAGGAIQRGPLDKARVAFTVDDFTGAKGLAYLRPLLALGIPLTLFPTGKAVEAYGAAKQAGAWQEAAGRKDIIIGNHTHHHYLKPESGFGFKDMSPGGRKQELDLAGASLDSVLGRRYPLRLMRPPGGSGGFGENGGAVVREMATLGYWTCMWTVDSNDSKGKIETGDAFFLDKTRRFLDTDPHGGNGAIILIHPTTLTIGGMTKMIEIMRGRGLDLRTIPGLFAAK